MEKEVRDQLYDPAIGKPRKMSKKSQIAFAKRFLKSKGISSDTVDLEALIDENLTYGENLEIIKKHVGVGSKADTEKNVEMTKGLETPCKLKKKIAHEMKQHLKNDKDYQDMKVERDNRKIECDCNQCVQMGLYDPKPKAKHLAIPKVWYKGMLKGLLKRSDISPKEAVGHVKRIWNRRSTNMKEKISKKKRHNINLPLPMDVDTKGTGVLRTVKPYRLVESQVNVSKPTWLELAKTKLFRPMKRQDGTIALVARCKSKLSNVNVFIDKW